MDNKKGLDMKETIEWYSRLNLQLPELSSRSTSLRVNENLEAFCLSSDEIDNLIELFPENAKHRSILKDICKKPITYFHKSSTSQNPSPTEIVEDALSPTAIIPSYIDFSAWRKTGTPSADIWLYNLPENIPADTRRIITAEGFLHEIGHSIVDPALICNDYKLKIPSTKEIVDGFDYICNKFRGLVESKPPISHYSSFYRTLEGKLPVTAESILTAIKEELCETIAAYFLGFAYCGDDKRGLNPFNDRPQIKSFVEDFLNSEKID